MKSILIALTVLLSLPSFLPTASHVTPDAETAGEAA